MHLCSIVLTPDSALKRLHPLELQRGNRMESNMRVNGPHSRPSGRTGLRILIVEDDADTADSMAILLRLYAYDVLVACDGVTALQMALEKQPDVVLLDIGLPKLDGWELARQLRSQISGKRPLLIAISGYG